MTDAEKETIKRKLVALAKNEIIITYDAPDAPLSAAASRIGGRPAVPKDFEWPRYAPPRAKGVLSSLIRRFLPGSGREPQLGLPLAFVAQINLKDAAPYDADGLLPKSGILSFFYDLESWGFDPSHRGSARVFYFPDEAVLTVADLPDDLEPARRIPEFIPAFMSKLSLPGCDEFEFLTDEDCEWKDFQQCRSECGHVEFDEREHFKLLGYPYVIQNPMEEECESVTSAFRSDGRGYVNEKEFLERAREWTLLLEAGGIYSDRFELSFGDCGRIYFWIRNEDLRNRNFENVWLVLQCD